MSTVVIVGAGLMGSGIAQVSAVAGHDVVLSDLTPEAVAGGHRAAAGFLGKLAAKGRIPDELAREALARITTTTDLEAVSAADLVVEAVSEDLDAKLKVFAELDRRAPADIVLASNTSAIPITRIAAATQRPERVIGTHFFSPVPLMPLCEIVRGEKTSAETLAAARAFAEGLGKTCIEVKRDTAGFVTTRLIASLVNEAVALVEAGVATPEDIDAACRLGLGHAMGPLATADLTGLDVMRRASLYVYEETQDPRFLPPDLLNRMTAAGDIGRKSGRGFYTYGA